MERMKVLVVDPLFEDTPDLELEAAGEDVELRFRRSRDGRLPDDRDYREADALLNFRSAHRIPREVVDMLDRCRVIVQGGVGHAHIDVAAAARRSIPVLNTPDYGTTEVADHAVALALNLLRGVQAYDRRLRRSNDAWSPQALTTARRIPGLRAGIVGLGRIGTATALRLAAFGMRIGFYDPFLPVGHELAFGFERYPTLEELMARSDVLSLHALLTPQTERMIDARTLALLPPDAVLVNTARGGLVELAAVHAALKSGRLAGAGLDVFETEPPDRSDPLIAAWSAGEDWLDGRLILTPHCAFYSTASIRDMRRLAMRYLMAFLREGLRPTCVNGHLLAQAGPHGP